MKQVCSSVVLTSGRTLEVRKMENYLSNEVKYYLFERFPTGDKFAVFMDLDLWSEFQEDIPALSIFWDDQIARVCRDGAEE